MSFLWTADLDTGINAIDEQHRRIVDYINQLEDIRLSNDRQIVQEILNKLIDYTESHFNFEESLIEEAGYPFFKAHRKVHSLFTRRVKEYRKRYEQGEDITIEIYRLLGTWLFNHIRKDDADYVPMVIPYINAKIAEANESKNLISRMVKKFF